MIQYLWVPGKLPGLNEIIDAKRSVVSGTGKRRPDGYSKLKKQWSQTIRIHALQQRLAPVPEAAHFTYFCVEENKRRDPGNFLAGAQKLIEDALQEANVLEGDGWKHVLSITSHWIVGQPNGVMVGIGTDQIVSPAELADRHARLRKSA